MEWIFKDVSLFVSFLILRTWSEITLCTLTYFIYNIIYRVFFLINLWNSLHAVYKSFPTAHWIKEQNIAFELSFFVERFTSIAVLPTSLPHPILNILFWKTDPFWFTLKILIDLQSLVNIFYNYKMTLHVITYTTRPILSYGAFVSLLSGQSRRFLAWSTFWHISFDEEDPLRQTLDYRYSRLTLRLPRYIFRISRCLISI